MVSTTPVEMVDIFDECGTKIGTVPRHHANGYITLLSQVYVINKNNELLVTLRGPTQRFPGWEFGITETIKSGERGLDAIIRGMGEELGIPRAEQPSYATCFMFPYRHPDEEGGKKNIIAYGCMYDGPIVIDEIEIVRKKFLRPAQIEQGITSGSMKFTRLNMESWWHFSRIYLNGNGGTHSDIGGRK